VQRRYRQWLLALIDEIVAGRLRPGHALPREIDLAEQFTISRGTAREAIRALEDRGLITVRHGSGATVLEREHWDPLDHDALAALLDRPDRGSILEQLRETQSVLRVEAAGLAAERSRHADADTREDIAAALSRHAGGPPSADDTEPELFQAVARAAGNETLATLLRRIDGVLARAQTPRASRSRNSQTRGRELMDAIVDGHPKRAREIAREPRSRFRRSIGVEGPATLSDA
jgi:GntR family transcriptional repressor for pyruvate dehydrogenase complex